MAGRNNSIDEILKVIKEAENIVIAGHINPDADSIGSSMALAHALNRIGKSPKVLIEEYNKKFEVLPGFNYVYIGSKEELNPEVFICLDCGDINRLGKNIEIFNKSSKTIVIDHHISNKYYGEYNLIDTQVSSTSELIYTIIEKLTEIDYNIASCIYAGILGDTGGFRFKSTSSYTLQIISKLLNHNIPFTKIYDEIMFAQNLNEFKAYINVVSRFNIVSDLNLAYVSITLNELIDLGVKPNDLDGIGDFIMRIKGIEITIFAYETLNNETKVSLRSKLKDVNKIASYFGGGGHINASGCLIKQKPEKAVAMVINKIREEH